MSGLPPAYGLATAVVPGVVAAAAGKSNQVVTGPTNTTGLLILAALGPYLAANGLIGPSGLPVVATLTLLVGLLRLAIGFMGGAAILDFFPESVLVGFATGAGVLIAAMQLDEALGMSAVHGGNLLAVIAAFSSKLAAGERPRWQPLVVTLATIATITIGRKRWPKLPIALLAVLCGALVALVAGVNAASGLPLVGDLATVVPGWPPGALPTLDLRVWRELLVPAAAIVMVGTLELTVVARAFGARPDMTREIRAQGLANVAGAFTSAFPASASLTRSALLKLGGAETRAAAVIAAIAVVPILFFGASLVRAIPLASLAGVLMVTAAAMIRVDQIRRIWLFARPTLVLFLGTFAATLVLPLEWAILGGAGLGVVIHLAETMHPRIELSTPGSGGALIGVPEGEKPREIVVEVSGLLHYAAVRRFLEATEARVPPETPLVVLDLTHAHSMRYAALLALERLHARSKAHGATLVLAGVAPSFATMLHQARSKLVFYEYDPVPSKSALRALKEHGAHEDGPSRLVPHFAQSIECPTTPAIEIS